MPPKAKKKRASLKLDTASGQVEEHTDEHETTHEPVRQVVEVVEEESLPEAIETIRKDTEEIEDAVETIEEEIEEHQAEHHDDDQEVEKEEAPMIEEPSKAAVESFFSKSDPAVAPDITVVGKRRGPSLGVWVGAMLGVALAIGVSLVFFVRGPSVLPFATAEPTPTPSPTEAPVPTAAPVTVEKSDIKIHVTNGGGTPGAASKMKAFLEDKGYTVVSVGNADEYTYDTTEVATTKDHDDYATMVVDDLKSDYTVSASSSTVSSSEDYDVEVIVGKE